MTKNMKENRMKVEVQGTSSAEPGDASCGELRIAGDPYDDDFTPDPKLLTYRPETDDQAIANTQLTEAGKSQDGAGSPSQNVPASVRKPSVRPRNNPAGQKASDVPDRPSAGRGRGKQPSSVVAPPAMVADQTSISTRESELVRREAFDPEAIVVDPEFKDLTPPQSEPERLLLEQSLLDDGCIDPLVLWGNIMVDGHNRFELCTHHDIPFSVTRLDFPDRNMVLLWIIRNQLGRRNLQPFQRAELALAAEKPIAKMAEQRMKAGKTGDLPPNLAEGGDTRDVLAKMAGVSHGSLDKVKFILKKADEKILTNLRKGETSIDREYKAVKRRIEGGTPKKRAGQQRFTFTQPPDKSPPDILAAFGKFILSVLEKLDLSQDEALGFLETLAMRCEPGSDADGAEAGQEG